MISSSQRPLPENTQHSQQTNIHAPGGIRTHNLRRRAAADLRLRPRCTANCNFVKFSLSRFRWPHCLRRGSVETRLLGLQVRIPPTAWMFVPCECCVFSDKGLCNGLKTRPAESYRLCVSLSVIKCNNDPPHVQRLGRQMSGLRKKERFSQGPDTAKLFCGCNNFYSVAWM